MFFSSVRLNNYRVFESLSIDDFAMINMFGGSNGVGKTTLLEALFTIVDIGNPHSLLRPFGFRRIAANANYVFLEGTKDITLQAATSIGSIEINISHRHSPNSYDVDCSVGDERYKYYYNNGASTAPPPGIISKHCVMINSTLKYSPSEENNRLSSLKRDSYDRDSNRQGYYAKLLNRLRSVNGDIEALELMQASDNPADSPVIHGTLKNGKTYPIPWLGEGVQTLLSVLLAIYDSPEGVVFIDEFESSIHFSKLNEVWRIISEAAKEVDCQIFVATHSRECIDAAQDGVPDDTSLRYIRLERSRQGIIAPIIYNRDALMSAESYSFEVR